MNTHLLQMNSLAMLPVIRPPAFNVISCPCPPMIVPQLLPTRCPANDYNTNLKAQVRMQTQQIDSAIQLLKMQYDAIMSSVQQSPHQSHLIREQPSPSMKSATSQVVDHKSFSMRFELSGPDFDEQIGTACVMDTPTTCKRKIESHPDGMLVSSLVKSDPCSSSKTSESSKQSKKRMGMQ